MARVLHWHDGDLVVGCGCGEDQTRGGAGDTRCTACGAQLDLALACRCNR